jgi:hypothetical protein
VPRRNLEAADHRDARSDPCEAGTQGASHYEYERNGVANLFMVFAPLEGWRLVKVTDRHTAVDYAHMLRDLSDVHFPRGNPELTRASQSPCRTTYSSAMIRAGHRRNQYDQPCGVRCGQPRRSLLPSPGQGSRAFVGRTGSVVYNPLKTNGRNISIRY